MKHIDVYSRLYVISKQAETLRPLDNTFLYALRLQFQHMTKLRIESDIFKESLRFEPTKRQMVKALVELGFHNKYIAELLNITPNNAAQHKIQPIQKEYRNIHWARLYSDMWASDATKPNKSDYTFPNGLQLDEIIKKQNTVDEWDM